VAHEDDAAAEAGGSADRAGDAALEVVEGEGGDRRGLGRKGA
jgi:hypothetical protein